MAAKPKNLSIRIVARLAGVSEHTIRAWERRYNALNPERTPSGRRTYTMRDVERLRVLFFLVEHGYSIGQIANLPDSELSEQESKLTRIIRSDAQSLTQTAANRSKWIGPMIEALQRFDLDALQLNLRQARNNSTVRQFILEIASPLMTEVGLSVCNGTMSIAQEHALSSVIRDHFGHLNVGQEPLSTHSQTVVLATPEGDLHEFGILFSAALCRAHGVRCHYLGPNIPARDLAFAAEKTNASIVILGISPVRLTSRNRPFTLSKFLSRFDKHLGPSVEVWLGGESPDIKRPITLSRPIRKLESLQALDSVLAQLT